LANQFPQRCVSLAVVDDMQKAGLGWTAIFWAAALSEAMRQNRALVELPGAHGKRASRWCWRSPGTLAGCFYEPWTHCKASLAQRAQHLSSFSVQAYKVMPNVTFKYEAMRFLFGRPLAWVRAMGDCVMRRDRLPPFGFVNVFLRNSTEKRAEARTRRYPQGIPGSDAPIVQLAHWLAGPMRRPRVAFVQSSSKTSLDSFAHASFVQDHALRLSYTNNNRSDHDDWGGWQRTSPDYTTAIAAVNLYIGSNAGALVGLKSSSWTVLQAGVMRRATPLLYLCCDCRVGDRGANIVAFAADGAAQFSELTHPHHTIHGCSRQYPDVARSARVARNVGRKGQHHKVEQDLGGHSRPLWRFDASLEPAAYIYGNFSTPLQVLPPDGA
jgi:hypothetical protein